MSKLDSLRASASLHDIADLLNFKPKSLTFVLYKIPDAAKYQTFQVPKRGGGFREINSPCAQLKLLQQNLSSLLHECIAEINTKREFKDQLAHGFKRQRSIITNSLKHVKRNYVFNIDLEDFFGTINFGRVRGFFIKDANFMLDASVATIIAQIASFGNGLPQGSPCSPIISNLIGHVLDVQLCRLASKEGCTYSRYADDITFSTNKSDFPSAIASMMPGGAHDWEVGPKLQKVIAELKFKINASKTRMQYKGSRQIVTGLVVNQKVNIRADYRRLVRAMAQRLFITGEFQFTKSALNPAGVISEEKFNGTVEQLHGMISHIDLIDRRNEEREARRDSGSSKAKEAARTALKSKQHLYKRFLLFKDFYMAPRPMIVCEGKTDNVYLIHAIKRLAAIYPKLAVISPENKPKLVVRILRTFESSAGRILHLAQGWSGLTGLIESYASELQKFKAPGLQNPVILLIDNDSAVAEVLKAIKKATKKNPSKPDSFLHVIGNLYVVVTPLKVGETESEIEDCFDKSVLQVSLGGKTFKADAKEDSAAHFGKHILSQYVRDHADTIDFTGFSGVLGNITAAIEDYESKIVDAPVVATVNSGV